MKRVSFAPEIAGEIVDAVRFYEQRQEGLGDRFLQAVRRRFETLPNARLHAVRTPHRSDIQACSLRKPWPYRVFMIVRDDELHVVALAHHRRHPDYWLARLDDE